MSLRVRLEVTEVSGAGEAAEFAAKSGHSVSPLQQSWGIPPCGMQSYTPVGYGSRRPAFHVIWLALCKNRGQNPGAEAVGPREQAAGRTVGPSRQRAEFGCLVAKVSWVSRVDGRRSSSAARYFALSRLCGIT
jgi:hypothetical protein